jgi:hypothetical protein
MPRGDGTGPMGQGSMTGRAAGLCAGYGTPGSMNPAFGRGIRSCVTGFGGGRGWRNMYYSTGLPGWARYSGNPAEYGYLRPYQKPDPEFEKQVLREQAGFLKSELDSIQKRLSEIETRKQGE